MKKILLLIGLVIVLAIAVRNVSAKTASGITLVWPWAVPVAQLPAGTFRVEFDVVADEMTTLWHSDSVNFEYIVWDTYPWHHDGITFTVDEPVTLYTEGFGCFGDPCGKFRNITISSVSTEESK